MHETDLIFTLTMALGVALGLGFITQKLGLSPIVGYLLAGVVVGPSTPGFVANHDLAVQLAEVGVILLMFGVGLHFHVKELLAVRRVALPGAIGQSLVATALGAAAAWSFGWGLAGGVVFGLSISVASTVVLTRVLADNNELHTQTGHIAIGWLVVEDLLTVVVLVLLPALVVGEGGGTDLVWALGAALLKIAALVAIVLGAGRRALPALLNRAANSGSRELFTLTVLVLALGIAAASTYFFDVSMALGAFLAGMVVGRSDFSQRAGTEALPMRDAFAVLFFVSVGMLLDFRMLAEAPEVILATLAIVLVGKPLAALAIVLALRYPLRVGLGVAVALAQIGEFSFMLGTLGAKLGVIDTPANNAIVAAAIVSIGINPLLYRAIDPVHRWMTGGASPIPSPPTPEPAGRHHAVVVGYGPVGRTLTRLLAENGIATTVVERNAETVREIREGGGRAVCGDAVRPESLTEAGIAEAGTLVLSSSSPEREEVIRAAKAQNPDIRVLVRTEYLRDAAALVKAGATQVFAGEGEVALAMNEAVMRELGATPEQIDRERERLHEDLWGFARQTP